MHKPTSKRSNFQFTYDADNYLLDLVFNYREDIFTRGNTIRTWEQVLLKFNQRFQTNIVQSRTINNRFKILRKNLENKLLSEQHPITELNLNENEKLLVSINEYISRRKRYSLPSDSDSGTVSKRQKKLSVSDSQNLVDERTDSTFASPTNTTMHSEIASLSPKLSTTMSSTATGKTTDFISSGTPKFSEAGTRVLFSNPDPHGNIQDVQQQAVMSGPGQVTGPLASVAQYTISTPQLQPGLPDSSLILSPHSSVMMAQQATQPTVQQIGSSSHNQQLPGQPQQQRQQRQSQQQPGVIQRSLSSSRISSSSTIQFPVPSPLSVQYLGARSIENLAGTASEERKQQQQQQSSIIEPGSRKRMRSFPKSLSQLSNNQELFEQYLIAQNEHNLQINELRRELRDFKDEVNFKMKNLLTAIEHQSTSVSIKMNNLFELMMTRKENDVKLDRIAKALELDAMSEFSQQPQPEQTQVPLQHSDHRQRTDYDDDTE